ncbi:unnamed protein product [Soboliphyme baturini]|uniref:LTD domain-containing protein n=1 Tax=Soboliphyme baturini TaxID=241478 RepID=A0A183J3C5_9BILA|nr:unnamed protein product [Soboliphyme baturini]
MNSFQEKRYVFLAGEPGAGESSFRRFRGPPARESLRCSSQGYISIVECDADGKYLLLLNNHRSRDQNMDRWKVVRRVNGTNETTYELPMDFQLKAGQSVKIWAGRPAVKADNDLVFEEITSWGVGRNEVTTLYNKNDQEKATLVKNEKK